MIVYNNWKANATNRRPSTLPYAIVSITRWNKNVANSFGQGGKPEYTKWSMEGIMGIVRSSAPETALRELLGESYTRSVPAPRRRGGTRAIDHVRCWDARERRLAVIALGEFSDLNFRLARDRESDVREVVWQDGPAVVARLPIHFY